MRTLINCVITLPLMGQNAIILKSTPRPQSTTIRNNGRLLNFATEFIERISRYA